MESPKTYSLDFTTLYLYTSLTAGSSHIITATSRLETILKANRIPFQAIDVATDEKARMLWGRRSKGRKLPGLVRGGEILGDLEQVEEWNEYGELKQALALPTGTAPAAAPSTPTPAATPAAAASSPSHTPIALQQQEPKSPAMSAPAKEAERAEEEPKEQEHHSIQSALRNLSEEAAAKAKSGMKKAMRGSLLPSSSPEPSSPLVVPSTSEEQQKSLDNAAPVLPPPSTISDAEAAKAPDSAGAKVAEPVESDEPRGRVLQEVSEQPKPTFEEADEATRPEKMTSSANTKAASVHFATDKTRETEAVAAGKPMPALHPATAQAVGTSAERNKDFTLSFSSPEDSTDESSPALPAYGSEGSAAISSTSLPLPEQGEALQHRDSNVSEASKEEIEEIEREERIDEEPEEEEEEEAEYEEMERKLEELKMQQKTQAEKTQEQPAKDSSLAGKSVGDV